MQSTISYSVHDLKALRVQSVPDAQGKTRVPTAVEVDGQVMRPTKRFWASVFHRYGINRAVFKYFSANEVMDRIVDRRPEDRLRLCVEQTEAAEPRLHGVSSPAKPFLRYEDAVGAAERHGGAGIAFADGVVRATFTPRSGEHQFMIGGDAFNNRFLAEMPVDGFGDPRVFLSLLRQVCTNGAVGYARAFRSDIRMGQESIHTLERALGQFDHDEGFAALRQRWEAAQQSTASVREVIRLQDTLGAAFGAKANEYHKKLNAVTGDLHWLYGTTNLNAMTVKRQRLLPSNCRMYDLLNFATEVATHKAPTPIHAMKLQAWVGGTISDEYDLEGTAENAPANGFAEMFAN